MTLLIVDDDTLVAQSLQAILEASGEVTVLAEEPAEKRLFLCISSTNLIFS